MVAVDKESGLPGNVIAPPADQAQCGALAHAVALVFLVASIIAGLLGAIATLLYPDLGALPPIAAPAFGALWGAVTGVIAAAVWCWAMRGQVAAGRVEQLAWWGSGAGLLVGAMSTVLLHLGLMCAAGTENPGGVVIGLAFGVPVGAIVGAVRGAHCRRVLSPRTGRS